MSSLCKIWTIVGMFFVDFLLGQTALADRKQEPLKYTLEQGIFYLPGGEEKADDYAKEKCRLDLYRPEGINGFPTVVFIHGGGMWGGKKYIPEELKNRGWAVAAISYRLHPKVRYPTRIEDSAAALAWVFKNIESRGGDASKIFVTGTSAGGYLTAMVGLDKQYLAKHDINANLIAGLIPVTGQMITHQTVRKEQGIEPSTLRPTIDQYAPLYHIRKDAPSTLCITGGWGVDMLMRTEENLYFVSMMKLVGHKNVRHIVIENANHGQSADKCWPHLIEFVKKTLAEH